MSIKIGAIGFGGNSLLRRYNEFICDTKTMLASNEKSLPRPAYGSKMYNTHPKHKRKEQRP